jgi:hypothetical protein
MVRGIDVEDEKVEDNVVVRRNIEHFLFADVMR